MQTQEPEEWTDDADVADRRERARAELDQIAQQAKQALSDAGIDLSLFFLVPNSGSTSSRSAPSPTHPTMRGTVPARSSRR